jgi:hypothetical protein
VEPGVFPIPDFIKGIGKLMGLPAATVEELKGAFARGEDPKRALDRILGKALPRPESPPSSRNQKQEKAAKAPPPEQGSLF